MFNKNEARPDGVQLWGVCVVVTPWISLAVAVW